MPPTHLRTTLEGDRIAASPMEDSPESGTRAGRFFLLSFLLFLALTSSLALITPVYGGFDERAHMTYGLAVVQGEVPFEGRDVEVENWVQSTWGGCWELDITQSSLCMEPLSDDTTQKPTSTTASNYPPVYYALVAWPSFFRAGSRALFASRLLSALLFSALAAFGVTALGAARGRPLLSVTAMTLVTPSAIALGGMVNPQALELGAAIATAGLLIPLLEGPSDSSRRLAFAAFTMFLWIQARPVGPVLALIFCLVLLLALGGSRIRSVLRMPAFWAFLSSATISSLLWLWWRTIAPPHLVDADECDLGCSVTHVISSNDLLQTTSTTGALNVHAPNAFIVPYYGVLLGVFLLALLAAGTRQAIAVCLGLLAIPAVALGIQIANGPTGGAIWQGRYALPLSLPLVLLALHLAYTSRFFSPTTARRFGVISALSYGFVMVPFAALATERFWLGVQFPSLFDVDWSTVPSQPNFGLALIAVACVILVVISMTARPGPTACPAKRPDSGAPAAATNASVSLHDDEDADSAAIVLS